MSYEDDFPSEWSPSSSPDTASYTTRRGSECAAYFANYFDRVSDEVETERASLKAQLDRHYDAQQLVVNKCRARFYAKYADGRLEAIVGTQFAEWSERMHQLRIELGELERCAKWKSPSSSFSERRQLRERIGQLEADLIESVVGDESVAFVKSSSEWLDCVAPLCGHVEHSDHIDSLIVHTRRLKIALRELCAPLAERRFTLLYRGTRDGFSAHAFHTHCDNHAPTLTLVKSAAPVAGCIFGGYASVTWNHSPVYKEDPDAFLFSLVRRHEEFDEERAKPQPRLIRCTTLFEAVDADETHGPAFGHGRDLLIACHSDINEDSYSNLSRAYRLDECAFQSDEARSFLAGSYKFRTAEVEVFHIE